MRNLLKLRFRCTFLTLFLVLSLIVGGCGEKEKKEEAKSAVRQEVVKKTPEEKAIKIGAILPLTGNFSLFGRWLKEGINFAIKEEKNTIKMICEDNANQTAKAVTAYQKLVNIDKVRAIVTARTPVANALTPLASSAKVFTVFTFADLPQGDKTYILNYHFPVSDECKVLAEFAKKKLGLKGAILVANDDFGRLGANFFKQYYVKVGGKIIYSEKFSPMQRDFRSLLFKLKKLQPDFIFIIAWEQNFLALTKAMNEMDLSMPIIGPNVLTVYLNLVKDYLPVSYFTMSFYDAGKQTSAYKEFVEKYRLKTGKEPNMVIAEAYEATKILLIGLKKQPYDLPIFFDNLKEYFGIFGKVTIDDNRQAHFPLAIVKIEKGQKKGIVWKFIP